MPRVRVYNVNRTILTGSVFVGSLLRFYQFNKKIINQVNILHTGPLNTIPLCRKDRYLDGSVLRAVRADLGDAVLEPVKLWFVSRVGAV